MEKLIKNFFEKVTFRSFFEIDLTATEKNTANESLSDKYTKGLMESILYGLIALPCILFIDISLLVSVLIPITMVSGTAWFAVSLVNIKKKFENFGNELTKDLYRTFCTSLILLTLISTVSLNNYLFKDLIEVGKSNTAVVLVSGALGTIIVIKMIYDVFAGATKYDMNDSMLTGQNEAAEKYFKRSLSLLSSCADNLRNNSKSTGVATYNLGLAFYEIYNYVRVSKGVDSKVEEMITQTEEIKSNPPATLNDMKKISIGLVENVIMLITNRQDKNTIKSLRNVQSELNSIRNNDEDIELLNLRLATILEELEDLLMSQGEALFMKRIEIERKFLVKELPELTSYVCDEIQQGYLSDEERIRKQSDVYTHTIKKEFESGYREEIEKVITKEKYNELWPLTKGRRISKVRYLIPLEDELKIELDVFGGENKGLVLGEVEFDSREKAERFIPPTWLGKEVTKDKKYRNASLAK